MKRREFLKTGAAAAVVAPTILTRPARAQSRADTLLIVAEGGPNSLDMHVPGANRPVFGLSWNNTDRLLGFGAKTLPNGAETFDYSVLKPELATAWQEASDGMSCTFTLRRDATFHDGRPVTAHDVKYSLDRSLGVGGFPLSQNQAGSLEKPEQFVVLDDHSFRVDYVRKDKLLLPDLAVLGAVVVNAELIKQHVTPQDPWGVQWSRSNDVGGGAYKIESWKPGQETVYSRFDGWKSGTLPRIRRIIFREIPSAANRRALLERGDADLSFDLPPKDLSEIMQSGKLTVIGVPQNNTVTFIGMNTQIKPFDDKKVRQAICFAIPYEKIYSTTVFNRCRPLSGGASVDPATTEWPQPLPYETNLERARALLAEAGLANGFEAAFSFETSAATINEPMAQLIQESLAQIGIKLTINKVPAGQLRGLLARKELPFFVDTFGGWFDVPDYFFYLAYHGQNGVWDSANYVNGAMTTLIDQARTERDAGIYDGLVKGMIKIAFEDVPFMELYQPFLDVAMQKTIGGYRYMFHRQLEFRTLTKSA